MGELFIKLCNAWCQEHYRHETFLSLLRHSVHQVWSRTVFQQMEKGNSSVSVVDGNSIPASPALLTLGAGGGSQRLLLMTSADNPAAIFTFCLLALPLEAFLEATFHMTGRRFDLCACLKSRG